MDELFDVALHDEQGPLQVGEGVAAAVHRFGHIDHAGENAARHHADGGEDGERHQHFQQGEGSPCRARSSCGATRRLSQNLAHP